MDEALIKYYPDYEWADLCGDVDGEVLLKAHNECMAAEKDKEIFNSHTAVFIETTATRYYNKLSCRDVVKLYNEDTFDGAGFRRSLTFGFRNISEPHNFVNVAIYGWTTFNDVMMQLLEDIGASEQEDIRIVRNVLGEDKVILKESGFDGPLVLYYTASEFEQLYFDYPYKPPKKGAQETR